MSGNLLAAFRDMLRNRQCARMIQAYVMVNGSKMKMKNKKSTFRVKSSINSLDLSDPLGL